MKLDKNKKILIGIAVLVVVVIVVAYLWPKAKDQQQTDEILDNSETISSGGQPTTFVPRPHTDKIWNDLNAWNPTPEVYQEINQLEDGNIRAIWKDWNKRYKSQYGNRELRASIEAGYWLATPYTKYYKDGAKILVDRLKSIGLP